MEQKEKKGERNKVIARALGKLWRTCIEFDLLCPNDRVLIGLSGGKDSLLLTLLLAEAKKYAPFSFDLGCISVDPGFGPGFPRDELQKFAFSLGLPIYFEHINVPQLAREATPCYSCAYFRRAAIDRRAKEEGYGKIAYAHHLDDAVETFYMNLVTSGQLSTFLPATYLSRSGLTVIRPLLYFREEEVRTIGRRLKLAPLKSPCPYDGTTGRQQAKEELARMAAVYPDLFSHLAAALRSGKEQLWPPKLSKDELAAKFHNFWHKS